MSSQRKGSSGREPLGIRRRACPAVRPLFQPQFVSSPPTRPRLLVSSVTTTSPSALLPSLMASGHLHASQWPLLLSAQAETLARLVVVHPRTVMTDRRLLFKTLVCAQTYVWPRAPLLTEPTGRCVGNPGFGQCFPSPSRSLIKLVHRHCGSQLQRERQRQERPSAYLTSSGAWGEQVAAFF